MNNRDIHIVNRLISEISAGLSKETFLDDERTKRAVCMTLINIGELVKNLTECFKADHPHIPGKTSPGYAM